MFEVASICAKPQIRKSNLKSHPIFPKHHCLFAKVFYVTKFANIFQYSTVLSETLEAKAFVLWWSSLRLFFLFQMRQYPPLLYFTMQLVGHVAKYTFSNWETISHLYGRTWLNTMLSTETFGIWLTYYIELSILHFQIKQKRAIKQSYAKDRKEVTRINTWSLQRSSVVTEMARLNAESVSSVFLPTTSYLSRISQIISVEKISEEKNGKYEVWLPPTYVTTPLANCMWPLLLLREVFNALYLHAKHFKCVLLSRAIFLESR